MQSLSSLQQLKNFIKVGMPISLALITFFDFPAEAQLSGDFPSSRDNELLETIPGKSEQGTILNPTNPMDLMNQLRKAKQMEDATSPSDAIDEALRALEANTSTSSSRPPEMLIDPRTY